MQNKVLYGWLQNRSITIGSKYWSINADVATVDESTDSDEGAASRRCRRSAAVSCEEQSTRDDTDVHTDTHTHTLQQHVGTPLLPTPGRSREPGIYYATTLPCTQFIQRRHIAQ